MIEEYREISEELKKLDFENQLLFIASYKAGRDMLLRPLPERLEKAIEDFKDDVYGAVLSQLNAFELFLNKMGKVGFVLNKCQLKINDVGRIEVYYKDKLIETTGFAYRASELDKDEIKKFFDNAIKTNRDICVEIEAPECEMHECVVTIWDDLQSKLKYYMENYDDDLCFKKDKSRKIVGIYLINFHF